MENEKRLMPRYEVAFVVEVEWRNESGESVVAAGVTDNVGNRGLLAYLPLALPAVGTGVTVKIKNDAGTTIAPARVLRLERNAARPQAALILDEPTRDWDENVCGQARMMIENLKPETYEEWALS